MRARPRPQEGCGLLSSTAPGPGGGSGGDEAEGRRGGRGSKFGWRREVRCAGDRERGGGTVKFALRCDEAGGSPAGYPPLSALSSSRCPAVAAVAGQRASRGAGGPRRGVAPAAPGGNPPPAISWLSSRAPPQPEIMRAVLDGGSGLLASARSFSRS